MKRAKIAEKKIPMTKIAFWYIIASCTVVQIYSMSAMWHFADLSSLYALIGATVSEAMTFFAYVLKSTKENTAGGIVYETAMREQPAPQQDTGPKG